MAWNYWFHGVEVTERRNLSARGAAGLAVFGGGFRCCWWWGLLLLLSSIFTYTTYTALTLCKSLIIRLLQASVSSVSKNKTLYREDKKRRYYLVLLRKSINFATQLQIPKHLLTLRHERY